MSADYHASGGDFELISEDRESAFETVVCHMISISAGATPQALCILHSAFPIVRALQGQDFGSEGAGAFLAQGVEAGGSLLSIVITRRGCGPPRNR